MSKTKMVDVRSAPTKAYVLPHTVARVKDSTSSPLSSDLSSICSVCFAAVSLCELKMAGEEDRSVSSSKEPESYTVSQVVVLQSHHRAPHQTPGGSVTMTMMRATQGGQLA